MAHEILVSAVISYLAIDVIGGTYPILIPYLIPVLLIFCILGVLIEVGDYVFDIK